MLGNFLFENDFFTDEFEYVLNKSVPKRKEEFVISNFVYDFNYGEFTFYIKDDDKEFKIPIPYGTTKLNDIWKFLETVVDSEKELLLNIFNKGREFIIYIKPLEKQNIRVCIMNTVELYEKERAGKILRYSFKECAVDMDIIIKKKTFLKEFYTTLRKTFIFYDPIAYFEPPVIDYEYWIKDSEKIREYLKIKRIK